MYKEPSIVHSAFDGVNIAAVMDEICKKHLDVSEYREFQKIGLGFNPGVVADMASKAYAMDANNIQQPLTSASVPTPIQFLQNWLRGFIKIVFAVRLIDELIGPDGGIVGR